MVLSASMTSAPLCHGGRPPPPVLSPRLLKGPLGGLRRAVWAGVSNLLDMPIDYCYFPAHLTPSDRSSDTLAQKALSATRRLAPRGLGTRQVSRTTAQKLRTFPALRVIGTKLWTPDFHPQDIWSVGSFLLWLAHESRPGGHPGAR